ncbi:methyltransferase domain-containing protein [Bosea caraganae]|uniref:Methyltransferase domain-containing protein n=1 Tax=Bosea caraganae TaxID=2763117 RepID=A0A370L5N8_9HYPH|nr:class I SAM-dependent methyltransferase [Bosea caraganae]RDJ23324.1 methyltransferase domain-containing protein [Bosea caraganae]RDJ24564.1 methyltransferase domain-containing protein [Bosea caraganae]
MATSDKLFAGPIPEIYDRLLVPLIFEPYADDLAGRVARLKPRAILEIAAGTGALTRAMASRLNGEAQITATDLNQAMLDRAAARQGADAAILWRQADASLLPFGDKGFDLVACQFGVMFFPDKVQAYREALRVLRPGGHYLFNAWDGMAANEFPHVVSDAVQALFPEDPPRFIERTPHGYHDPERIREELTEAGFHAVMIEALSRTCRAHSAQEVATAFCQGTPLRSEIEARSPGDGLEAATRVAAEALTRRFGSEPIEGQVKAFVVTALRP